MKPSFPFAFNLNDKTMDELIATKNAQLTDLQTSVEHLKLEQSKGDIVNLFAVAIPFVECSIENALVEAIAKKQEEIERVKAEIDVLTREKSEQALHEAISKLSGVSVDVIKTYTAVVKNTEDGRMAKFTSKNIPNRELCLWYDQPDYHDSKSYYYLTFVLWEGDVKTTRKSVNGFCVPYDLKKVLSHFHRHPERLEVLEFLYMVDAYLKYWRFGGPKSVDCGDVTSTVLAMIQDR